MVHVSSRMWRIKNQPSNSTSCSDNELRLLALVTDILYQGLQVIFSFSIWGCILKGYFERGIFWRTKLCLKGIEDFNLEHWVVAFKRSLCLMTGNKTISSRFGKEEGEVLEVTKTSHDTMKPQLKVLSPYLGHAKSNNIFYFVLSTFNIGIAWWKIQNALSEQHATMRKYLSTRQHTTIL